MLILFLVSGFLFFLIGLRLADLGSAYLILPSVSMIWRESGVRVGVCFDGDVEDGDGYHVGCEIDSLLV